ncbi:MAG: toast rack family protein [Coriobacteriia bacterium]|nr:toast rack family protein [Coriobacteriia bacterium]
MKDRSIPIIIAVVLIGMIALGTGFRRVENTGDEWYANLHIGDRIEADEPQAPEEPDSPVVGRTATEVVELGTATRAEVRLAQPVGELKVRGASGPLMDAQFDTKPKRWTPEVDYRVDGEVGELTVRQSEFDPFAEGDTRNNWDVALDTGTPMDLVIERGAGEADLLIGDLLLLSARIVNGAGETTIDLTGGRELDDDVEIDVIGGVGAMRLALPNGVPVRVTIDQGIGEVTVDGLSEDGGAWVNDAYDDDRPAYEIRVKQGIGEVSIELGE